MPDLDLGLDFVVEPRYLIKDSTRLCNFRSVCVMVPRFEHDAEDLLRTIVKLFTLNNTRQSVVEEKIA